MSFKQLISQVFIVLLFIPVIVCSEGTEQEQKNIIQIERFVGDSTIKASALRYDNSVGTSADNATLFMHENLKPNHVRGGRIYDNFLIELFLSPTIPNALFDSGMPTDPTKPVPDLANSYRCSTCHGYDYKGGIYTYQNGATNNLLELREIRQWDEQAVYNLLLNGLNIVQGAEQINTHNYTGILSAQALVDVADFVVNEIYDTQEYIRGSTKESVINHMPAMFIYRGAVDPTLDPVPAAIRIDGSNFTCTRCHGVDGRDVVGVDLYALAWSDPYKWMHRVNFGSPRDQFLFPDITAEDDTIHPGVFEIILTNGLFIGGPVETASMLEYTQTHFMP